LALAVQRNPREYTAKARATFLQRFLDEQPVDLPPEERQRRAEAARKLHFTRLALASAKARQKSRKGTTA